MPVFKTIRITMDGSVKNELDFKTEVFIDADGLFTTTIPESIAQILKSAGVDLNRNTRRGSRPGFFSHKTFDGLVAQIKEACKEYVSKELIEESVVIRYVIKTTCSYLINEHGEVVPNGNWLNGLYATSTEYMWRNGTTPSHASSPEPYSISLFVQPVIKRRYRYKSGKEKMEMERISRSRIGEKVIKGVKMGEHLFWLSEIVSHCEPGGQEIEEIEYTEKNAFFFVNFVKTICKLNEKLKDLSNPANLRLLISQNFNLLDFKPQDNGNI